MLAQEISYIDLAMASIHSTSTPILIYISTFLSVVELETSNGLMPAAGELMMINRLLIVPIVKQEILNIVVTLCVFVLRPKVLWCCNGVA